MLIEAVDVEGAWKAYLAAVPGLSGTGNPIAGGMHLGHAQLPKVGAVGEFQVAGPRTLDDISDNARVQAQVRAAGKAAREVAEAGCRALAVAVLAIAHNEQPIVQTRRGDWVRILVTGDSSGPTLLGLNGAEAVYGFDWTTRCQPTTRPYGEGVYGEGPYGG